MTDEVKEEVAEVKEEVQEEKAEVVEAKPTPIPAPANLKIDHKEASKKLQGKKATIKKKINKYTRSETYDELKRLEKAGHQQSIYYLRVKERAQELA